MSDEGEMCGSPPPLIPKGGGEDARQTKSGDETSRRSSVTPADTVEAGSNVRYHPYGRSQPGVAGQPSQVSQSQVQADRDHTQMHVASATSEHPAQRSHLDTAQQQQQQQQQFQQQQRTGAQAMYYLQPYGTAPEQAHQQQQLFQQQRPVRSQHHTEARTPQDKARLTQQQQINAAPIMSSDHSTVQQSGALSRPSASHPQQQQQQQLSLPHSHRTTTAVDDGGGSGGVQRTAMVYPQQAHGRGQTADELPEQPDKQSAYDSQTGQLSRAEVATGVQQQQAARRQISSTTSSSTVHAEAEMSRMSSLSTVRAPQPYQQHQQQKQQPKQRPSLSQLSSAGRIYDHSQQRGAGVTRVQAPSTGQQQQQAMAIMASHRQQQPKTHGGHDGSLDSAFYSHARRTPSAQQMQQQKQQQQQQQPMYATSMVDGQPSQRHPQHRANQQMQPSSHQGYHRQPAAQVSHTPSQQRRHQQQQQQQQLQQQQDLYRYKSQSRPQQSLSAAVAVTMRPTSQARPAAGQVDYAVIDGDSPPSMQSTTVQSHQHLTGAKQRQQQQPPQQQQQHWGRYPPAAGSNQSTAGQYPSRSTVSPSESPVYQRPPMMKSNRSSSAGVEAMDTGTNPHQPLVASSHASAPLPRSSGYAQTDTNTATGGHDRSWQFHTQKSNRHHHSSLTPSQQQQQHTLYSITQQGSQRPRESPALMPRDISTRPRQAHSNTGSTNGRDDVQISPTGDMDTLSTQAVELYDDMDVAPELDDSLLKVAMSIYDLSTCLDEKNPDREKLDTLTGIVLQSIDQQREREFKYRCQAGAWSAGGRLSVEYVGNVGNETWKRFHLVCSLILPAKAKQWERSVYHDAAYDSTLNVFRCHFCNDEFKRRRELEYHYLGHRRPAAPYLCLICGKCSPDRKTNDSHLYRHVMKDVTCQLCGNAIKSITSYLQHWIDDHFFGTPLVALPIPTPDDSELTITPCKSSDMLPQSLPAGRDRDAVSRPQNWDEKVSCYKQLAAKISPESAGYWQTRVGKDPSVHQATGDYWCGQCEIMFQWRRDLEFHFLTHIEPTRPSVCHICGRVFSKQDHTNRHAHVHNLGDLICQLCGDTFTRNSHLERHWNNVHFPNVSSPQASALNESTSPVDSSHALGDLSDAEPEESFNASPLPGGYLHELLTREQTRHVDTSSRFSHISGSPKRDPKPITRMDRRRSLLSTTTPTSTGEKERTPRRTAAAVAAVAAAAAEEDSPPEFNPERPYKCRICHRAFKRSAHLVRHEHDLHQVQHDRNAPRSSSKSTAPHQQQQQPVLVHCQIAKCNAKFLRRELLCSHMQTAHGKSAIVCKHCDRVFTTNGALTNHAKTHERAAREKLQKKAKKKMKKKGKRPATGAAAAAAAASAARKAAAQTHSRMTTAAPPEQWDDGEDVGDAAGHSGNASDNAQVGDEYGSEEVSPSDEQYDEEQYEHEEHGEHEDPDEHDGEEEHAFVKKEQEEEETNESGLSDKEVAIE